ncbi:MAG: hypothetical protein AAFZ87_14150 [Planctomycetota bacterium]
MKITASLGGRAAGLLLAAATSVVLGCSGGEAEAGPAPGSEAPADGSAPAAEAQADAAPRFALPDGWTELEPSGQMRHKEFRFEADDAALELVVYRWGQGMGGVEQNIENWVGPDRDPADLTPKERQEFTSRAFESTALFLDGGASPAHGAGGGPVEGDARFYAFIETPDSATVWTVKCTGPAETMVSQRSAFEGMLQGL